VYLRTHGANVRLTDDAERPAFRSQNGIPEQTASCHTSIVEGYVIEGHVPVDAIRRVIDDRPDAVGLALPGMPADSPGMGGDADAWDDLPVVLIGRDGSLTEFDY
jgi:hypothetical protein